MPTPNPTASNRSANSNESQMILENIQEIVTGLDVKVTAMNQHLMQSDEKREQVQADLAAITAKLERLTEDFQQVKTALTQIDAQLGNFEKRFDFASGRFNTIFEQIDHLDTEFSSLKTLVLAAVDKAMKEYSNFVVEKLTLGNTIDVLRLEVDKMKKRIEKLEQI